MKKTLAILLALLMVCSALAATLSVSATEETDWEAVANELELTIYVGDEVTTAPEQDGVISDGEYTATKTTAIGDLSVPQDGNGEVQGENVVEYYAHDAANFYYAIVFTQTNDNRACWPQFMVNNSFNVFTNDTGDNINDYHNRATLQARYLADGTTINNGIGAPRGAAAPTFAEDGDFWVNATKDTETNVKTYEFKFAKSYIATANNIDAADVRVIPMWTFFHATTSTAHVLTDADMEVLTAAGVGEIRDFGVGKNMYNYVVLDAPAVDDTDPYKALLDDLGLTTYVPYVSTAPVLDGVVNDGEYSYAKTWTPEEIYQYNDGAEIQSGVNEYVAHDADYIYYAVVFTQEANNRALQWQFQPTNTLRVFNSKDDLRTTLFQRITWQLRYQDNGETTLAQEPTWNYEIDDATPQVGEGLDLEYAATKTAENVKTYEIKLAKAYIANYAGCEVADVNVLPYFTYFHSVSALGHNYTTEETEAIKALGATRADTGLLYRFLVLEPAVDAPEEEEPEAPISNLADLYDATYVGAALSADAAKPVQDGKLTAGEYQIMFDGGEAFRAGVPAELIAPVKQYIAHDADYIYVAFEFVNAKSNTRGRLYWNVSFIDSFDFDFVGGTTVADAFKQNGNAINAGWNFGGEVKEDITEGYSDRNNAVPSGKVAPVLNEDFFVAIGRDTYTGEVLTNRQVYEFKVSKAWYAAQAGLESAADVRELAWVVLGEEINTGCSSYTQIGHYVTPEERAYLFEAYGVEFKPAAGNSHPYDNQMLPLLFVLDADPEGDAAAAPTEAVTPAQTWASYVPEPENPGDGGDQPDNPPASSETPSTETPSTAPATTTAAESTAAASTTAKATTAADETTAAETEAAKKGCKGSIAISALVLLPTLAGGALLAKRRRED